MALNEKLSGLFTVSTARRADWRLILLLGIFGALLVAAALWATLADWRSSAHYDSAFAEGQQAVDQVAARVNGLNALMRDAEVQGLAAAAVQNDDEQAALLQALQQRVPQVKSATAYSVEAVHQLDPVAMGTSGYAILDLLLTVVDGLPGLLQFHEAAEPSAMYSASIIGSPDAMQGVLLLQIAPAFVLQDFNPSYSSLGYVRLAQYNGRQAANRLAEFGNASLMGTVPDRIPIAHSMLRVEFPQVVKVERLGGGKLILLILVGLACLGGSWVLLQQNKNWLIESEEREKERRRSKVKIVRGGEDSARLPATADPEEVVPALQSSPDQSEQRETGRQAVRPPDPPGSSPADAEFDQDKQAGSNNLLRSDPPPMRLQYNYEQRKREKEMTHEPVELLPEIFRAYDIRGIVEKTLDSGVAKSVGQVVGSLALEQNAGPVVVARDGRHSGKFLMDGMIEGITSTGCDVLDIGAVPTGVLYYAAHEFAGGSGVMITGSHNPPDYNGFKIMIGGGPLHGDAVTDIYSRICSGNVRVGQGTAREQNVVQDYIQRIASDIKVERPLKVVIDCGNGIGGVCAAETLRALGVETLPLFDEVDGDFPNHHPDPSDPENLTDLIEAVRLMDADLGLALDGDADRLGVVTLGGEIIYPDRVMMLLALDVLDRVPGATIIYDVKCTGHLPKVIEEAGGKAVMYKTGHSLIKSYMKEIDSPFAGEMSGHFFFGERWYGVDDGIYAAARLLEILGGTETPPEAILSALPTSFSTPELKVQMSEGENHAFVEQFQSRSRFELAKISTIDGLRADFEDGWGLVRASNTTPILVVRFDAESEEALNRIKATFRSQMLEINPDLDLPF